MVSCRSLSVGAVILLVAVYAIPTPKDEGPVCVMDGREYQVGENMTNDPCDHCQCTPYGQMCSLMACPEAPCVNKVRGLCCDECPDGPETHPDECLYEGSAGDAIIPETGCKYSDSLVCYCHLLYPTDVKRTHYCLRPFPSDMTPPCTINRA